ncbi:OmpA family protein [Flavobacterium sp. ASW18X]|uniref:OmpA family protein n=1 Tax=Flavobacterium sp. ASW18X TaxID=2572595 RepID=UPI0010AE5DF9|nr:OmpA family protein [Flavobacterium sp. ASW18X]TKD65261.1 cell envelope biogenesis protein OmpA [Flavobacterium sp. ASW18X]
MSRNLTYIIGILITIILGIFLYFNFCSCCMASDQNNATTDKVEEITTPKTPEATKYPFALTDGDWKLNEEENFNFSASSANYLEPLAPSLTEASSSLKSYLTEHPEKAITITGFYKDSETNTSAWPNLGLARANTVKNYMVNLGVPSSQTTIAGTLKEEMIPSEDNIYYGPLSYTISAKKETSAEDLKTLHDKIVDNPLVLYFNTGEATINLTATQRQKIADIGTYLDKVPSAMCDVVGHTDNTGNRINNITLGQERADFAKSYLVRNGIPANKIISESKGPDEPIADNATEEGRSKNRRTVITLK